MISARKKVLLLIPNLKGGGAERFFSLLLQYLDRNRFEPHLALFAAEGEYLKDLPQDVVVHDLGVSRARYALSKIIRLVWKVRPQTILSTLSPTNVAVTLSRPFLPRDTRLLLSEAAFTSAVFDGEVRHRHLWNWLYRRFYKRADKVVCLCDSMIDDMAVQFRVPREKLMRIYYPVDVHRVRELAAAGGSPYSGSGPHLVAAGRLCRQKGFDFLLDAMPSVLKHLPQAHLTILGEGELRGELTEQLRQLGLSDAVSLPGFQQNPWRYFSHADLFVLSSRYEGLPNVLLEALAAGVPVVATDCPGALREVQAYCKGMVLAPSENPAALADAIVSACARFRSTRPQQDMSNFDLHSVVGEYSRLLWG